LGRTPSTIEVGDLILDPSAGSVLRAGRPIELTSTERRLLEHLATHRGQVLSKVQLLTAVWGYEDFDPNLVEVHISALRRKLGEPRLLHTVRGLGYVLRTDG
jgi:DNA-binding response OmpR family regulator